MLPSDHWDGVGTPESGFRGSMTRPTSPSVNASPASSRSPTHDSRPPWVAGPSVVGRFQVPSLGRFIPALPSRTSSTAAGTPPPRRRRPCPAGSHRSQDGTSVPPSLPEPWPPPFGQPGRRQWAHLTNRPRRRAASGSPPPAPEAESSDPEHIRFQILYRLFFRSASNAAKVYLVHSRGTLVGRNPPVRLPHHRFGNVERLDSRRLSCSPRFLPGPHGPG